MGRPIAIKPSQKVISSCLGLKFGKLTITSFSERVNGSYKYNCVCDCGNKTVAHIAFLKKGHTKSCGCLKSIPTEWLGERFSKHGKSKTRIYRIWSSIIKRCTDSKTKHFHRYGGRGISICEEWLILNNFEAWAVSHGYSDNLSIDRIDNDGNYEPSNCRWATSAEQANNTKNNVLIEYNGETLSLSQWSLRISNNPGLVWSRINQLGWSEEKAIITPLLARGYTLNNVSYR